MQKAKGGAPSVEVAQTKKGWAIPRNTINMSGVNLHSVTDHDSFKRNAAQILFSVCDPQLHGVM